MKTVRLLNISLILLVLSLITAFSWTALGFKNEEMPFIAILFIICFGLNVAGIFVGLNEERKSKKKFFYGVIGNSILVGLYMTFFIYVLTTM
jgi:hypothetical protein